MIDESATVVKRCHQLSKIVRELLLSGSSVLPGELSGI